MALGGVAADIIEVKSSKLRVTMAIRQDNRLIADLSGTNVDRGGEVLYRSNRTFAWSNVNKPLPASTFAVGTGKTPRPIKGLK